MKRKIVTSVSLLACAAFTYGWLKDNGDFATKVYVQEAKAETIQQVQAQYVSKDAFNIVMEDIKHIRNKVDQISERK